MKKFRMVLVGLIVAAGVMLPLIVAAVATPASTATPIVRIADGPTPTPTDHFNGGDSGCHGQGC